MRFGIDLELHWLLFMYIIVSVTAIPDAKLLFCATRLLKRSIFRLFEENRPPQGTLGPPKSASGGMARKGRISFR